MHKKYSRPHGPYKGRHAGGHRKFTQSKRFSPGANIDVNKFINKAVITEEVTTFVPEHSFSDFNLDSRLKQNILAKGYSAPTPIQDRAMPHVLRGDDVVGIANTGTGKTAAFLIPLINKVLANPSERVLIVTPVRELAMQIEEELRGFAKGSGFSSAVLIGGASMGTQIRDLRYKPNFIIGTPGRIKDHLDSKVLDLSPFKTLVLDEADRMLDMGFIGSVRLLVSKMNIDRQTLFFSATLSKEIENLIHEFLRSPARISVKTRDTSKNVDQDVIRIQGKTKLQVLKDLLLQEEFTKTLVFSRTKHGAEKLARDLITYGIRAGSIHGNKNQSQRLRVLEDFKKERINVLVATDVAARGLDISDISHVINYDLPSTYEDYVHRIGRTGRASKTGKALTFIE